MATVLKVPPMGESVVEGTINKWFVEVGQPIKKDQPIVELLTDKVNVSIPAEVDGVLLEILAPVGAIVPVGKEIAVIGAPGEKSSAATPAAPAVPAATVAKAAPASSAAPVAVPSGEPQKLSPAVRRLIKEHGVDVTQLTGTGAGGRVTQKDVEDYIGRIGKPAPAATSDAGTLIHAAGFTSRSGQAHRGTSDSARAQTDFRAHGEIETNLGARNHFRRVRFHSAGRIPSKEC